MTFKYATLCACLFASACGGSAPVSVPTSTPTSASLEVRKTVALGVPPANVLADPPRGRAYVINIVGENVKVLDGFAGTVIDTLTLVKGPTDIALDLDLRRLYIVSNRELRVVAVDLDSLSIVAARVLSRRFPENVAVDPVAHLIYVTHPQLDVVTVLDGVTLEEKTIFAVPYGPSRVGVDSATHLGYVTKLDGGSVDIIDGDHSVATVPVGLAPDGVTVDSSTHTAYVSVTGANFLAAVDATTVGGTLPVGSRPGIPAIDKVTRTLYVPNSGDNTLSAISLDTKQTLAVVPVGRFPIAAAVDTATHVVYVANRDDKSVSVVVGIQ